MVILWKYFSSWVSIFVVWLKSTNSWILCLYQNKIHWFYIFNITSFTGINTSRKLQYIRQMSCRITCSFSKLFYDIYQLRIETKSTFEFHNYRTVQISVILSNLKIKKKIIGNYFMSMYIRNFHQYILNLFLCLTDI